MALQLQGHHCEDLFEVVYFGKVPCRAMTEWTLLKRLLDAVHQHSTMIGRIWLTVMVIFRLLVVAVATEDVYTDEQEMFVCNTMQPGCANVCYDAFAPVSQPRFWVFQIITVSTPSLCFIIYTWHSLSKQHENDPPTEKRGMVKEAACDRSCSSDSCSVRSHRHLGHSLADVLEGINVHRSPGLSVTRSRTSAENTRSSGVLSKYYIFHVCSRAFLEVGFVFAQWLLFGFQVPSHYSCTASPCSQTTDCYISRPTEKTVFLIFMFCVGIFCIFLSFLELNHLGWKQCKRTVHIQGSWRGYEAINQDSQSVASLTFRDGTGSLPTLELVMKEKPHWACPGNCTSTLKDETGGLSQSTITHKETQCVKSKSVKGRGSNLKSAEVWI